MLDSVLVARDRFLAPGGALYPSQARLLFAPARSSLAHQRAAELQVRMGARRAADQAAGPASPPASAGRPARREAPTAGSLHHRLTRCAAACAAQHAMEGWAAFTGEIKRFYGVDMSVLDGEYRAEQVRQQHRYRCTAALPCLLAWG